MLTTEGILNWVISYFLFTIEGDEDEIIGCWTLTVYLARHSAAILMLLRYKQTENVFLLFIFETLYFFATFGIFRCDEDDEDVVWGNYNFSHLFYKGKSKKFALLEDLSQKSWKN